MLNILMLDLTGSVFMCEVELGSGLKARGKTCSGEKTNIREVFNIIYSIFGQILYTFFKSFPIVILNSQIPPENYSSNSCSNFEFLR